MEADLIFRGAPVEEAPELSFGEYIFSKLEKIPKNKVIHIDSETGEVQTAGEFITRSIQLLEGLKKQGLQQKDVIAMFFKNCFEANEILLAGWLGAAVVAPFNSSSTVFELKNFFGLIKPKFIFCVEESINSIESALILLEEKIKHKIILLKKNKISHNTHMAFEELLVDVNVKNFFPQKVASSLDYILILPSSGTSGLPKGTGLTHKSLISLDLQLRVFKPFTERGTTLQISHFFWVSGIFVFLMTLSWGMTRITLRNPLNKNILEAFQKYKPEWTIAAPLTIISLINDPHFQEYDLSSIKTLVIGGSALTMEMIKRIKTKLPNTNLIQMYGLTEAFAVVTYSEEIDESIGLVFPGVQAKIVDTKTGEALKSDAIGEICVKSPGMMKNYIGNEELTRLAIDSEGWLHSGDLGSHDKNGKFYLVGRIKDMVKVKNMQVAPAEIENLIFSIHGVDEVAVVDIPCETNLNLLMAIVVKKKGVNVTEKDIHSLVNENLSDYKKLTAGVYFVESLPKTASGKIQKSQLKILAKELLSKNKNIL